MNLIGKIKSLHGVGGQIMLAHNLHADIDFSNFEALMIELLPGSYIPFFIESINEINDSQVIVKFEEYSDRNKAIEILNKNVYAPPGIEIQTTDDNPWMILVGFTLKDQNQSEVGLITDIMMNASQMLLEVNQKGKEHLIPFSDELILSLDQTNNTLVLEIADGLLDL